MVVEKQRSTLVHLKEVDVTHVTFSSQISTTEKILERNVDIM